MDVIRANIGLQDIDLVQILCNYAMSSFGIKGVKFTIDNKMYYEYRKQKITNKGFDRDFIIELVAYALQDSIYAGYILVSSNKFVKEELLDALIEERYIEGKEDLLNAFDGYLTNPDIDEEIKVNFYTNFKNLDNDFFKIKRRDSEYLNYEKDTNY